MGSDPDGASVRLRMNNFYPRSPRGERRGVGLLPWSLQHFYPRSPRGERRYGLVAARAVSGFLSTLPAWGATFKAIHNNVSRIISIHAPRVGSDILWLCLGEYRGLFLSTLPAWGATAERKCNYNSLS